MKTESGVVRWALLLILLWPGTSSPGPAVAAAPDAAVVVLDTTSFWRMHHTLKPPVIQRGRGAKPLDLRWIKGERVLSTFDWARRETAPPPKDWTKADYDDSTWLRGPARMSCRTAFLSRLCMRGRFKVTHPSQVRDLRLSLAYRGGVIVYMNGKEVARHQLLKRAAGTDLLATGYPAEAFTPTSGWNGEASRKLLPETDEEISLRRRTVEIPIPSSALRRGINVLGIEVVRAPYSDVLEEKKDQRGTRYCPYYLAFNTCQIDLVQLKAAGRGIVPNAVRPKGFQVWNNNMLGADFDLDFGDPGPLRPIRLVGARNGLFSGKVVAGSRSAIRGLRVTASGFSGRGGTLPASAVRIRYGIPWGREAGVNGQRTIHRQTITEFDCYPRAPAMLGALAENPLEEFPVRTVEPGKYDLITPDQPDPIFGAVVPIWVTVRVPGNMPAGFFKGQITIRAKGAAAVRVPVELTVIDYTLPDPRDYRTVLELIQSPDTLAIEYDVEPWSDRHFELIAGSMKLMHEAGVQVLYVPLIAETNLGNEQTMVRWIETTGKTYRHDFSIMDRYLDLAAKYMGQPKVVCFVVWDIYLGGEGGGYKDTWDHNQRSVDERKKYIGKGPMVTFLNPTTRKAETGHLPLRSDPAGKADWKKLFIELRERMARRGWESSMMIGLMSDDWPDPEETKFYREVSGGLPWVSHSHVPVTRDAMEMENGIVVTAPTAQGSAKMDRAGHHVGYHSAVLSCTFADNDPPLGSNMGWKRPDLGTYQPRYERTQPASRWRQLMELNITGGQRGVSRGGADFWPAVRDRRGRRRGTVAQRYPQSAWRNLDIPWTMFAPGPEGPVATHHFEALREGIQECQARILIEEALTDSRLKRKLGPDLARRCEDMLIERTHLMLKAITHLQVNNQWGHITGPEPICRQNGVMGHRWYVGSGWQARSEELYRLAGEVSRKIGRP